MAPTQEKSLRILIAGAGIGGLSLAIFLERAKIDYVIIERSPSLRTVGGALGLSPQAFRVFEQIGLFEELATVSKPMVGIKYFNDTFEQVGGIDGSFWEKRYGYTNRIFARCDLMNVLLRHVPPHKIHWGKKVQSTVQNEESVSVVCSDASHYEGDILIGSDGAYSTIRTTMYKTMQEKGRKVSKGDLNQLRFGQFAILGVTSDISDEWPVLKEPTGSIHVNCAGRHSPYSTFAIPMVGGRVNWLVGGYFNFELEDKNEFRFSDWESESTKAVIKEIENLPAAIGGTIGYLLSKTEHTQITRTMLEDKIFDVWYDGRTCLMGDAIHKTLPAGGQGANQTILDAVCLANLLYELPSTSVEDITKMFSRYHEIRFTTAKKSVDDSALLTDMIVRQGITGDLMRTLILGWTPNWALLKIQDSLMGERPLLTFERSIDDKGEFKDTSKPHTLKNGAASAR